MPRSAAVTRKNQGNRHENGLVVPGKRVTKQKSNGNLNGTANGVDPPTNRSSSDQPMPSAAAESHQNGALEEVKTECNGRTQANGYGKGESTPPYESAVNRASGNKMDEQSPRRGDKAATASAAANKKSSSSINPFLLASTILKSCPMYDTIAILIFLLQLPPIVLTLVQFLFASLTFLPPSGASSGSLTSNFDIFQGPAGTPSLGTMIAMDGFCLLLWGLFMWNWAQNFALDLAHVQVAITLGGGGSGKNGGVNALCVGIVLILHLLRSKGVQDFVLGHLLSAKIVSPDVLSQYSHLIPAEFRRPEAPASPSWARSLLAVHILAQAGTAMARRSMAKNRSPPPSRSGKRADTEASAGSAAPVDSSAFESAASVSSLLGPDGQILGSPALKDSRDRLTSAKKRRRQANQVRSRQPFWAALASTKVTVMREYEHSRVASRATRALPVSEDDLQGAPVDDGLIWITYVDSSCIEFAASDFFVEDDPASESGYLADGSEPFYVRVNGAQWAATAVRRVPGSADQPATVQWRGEISGLAPDCTYTCSFVRCDTDEQICVTSVRTPSTPDTEQATSFAVTPSPRQALRPSSPTTTIKNSIINAEIKLNERRGRMKRAKNDCKLHISKIKKEIENYNNRLSSGNDENRQKQRSLQLERNIKQTEEATASLEHQLDSLENVPPEEIEEWTSEKAAFDRQAESLNAAKEDLTGARMAVSRELASIESDLTSAIQRRERLQARRTRLNEQHERITTANAQGLNERERRAAEQFAREQDQAKIEESFHEQLSSITRSIQEYQIRTAQLWQQAAAIEQAIQQHQQQQILLHSGPLTPEGNLPGTNPLPPSSTSASGPLTTTGGRSLLGLTFPSYPSHQTSSPPITTNTSLPSSPAPMYLSHVHHSLSPATSRDPFFGPEPFNHRDRAFSNRSTRSSMYEDGDNMDTIRGFPFKGDVGDFMVEMKRSTSGLGSGAGTGGAGMIPFTRKGSGGSGSGSGSRSGTGSPSSPKAKSIWS